MNEPITKLDTRYSEPDGVVTPWEETRSVLETAELFWLTTVRADDRPHSTPVVAVWHDGPSTSVLPIPNRRPGTCVQPPT